MKLLRLLLALGVLAGLTGVAFVGQQAEPAGAKMAMAANKFLAALKPEQKQKATFAFDDKERVRWFFTPQQDAAKKPSRKGLALEDMTEEQKQAALDILKAGTSPDGFVKATTIMSLESILRDLEKSGRMVRDPNWYFFAVFGDPSKTGKWGWRVEGHHLALNFTLDGSRVVAATPAFFGANPAEVKQGPRKGLRTLAEAEDLARELFRSLDEDQKKAAFQKERFPEIKENTLSPDVGDPKGLPAHLLSQEQRGTLRKLVESYAKRLPEDIAGAHIDEVRKGGVDKIFFAYSGGVTPGQGYTYRIHGPSFVIEFLNEQNDSAGNAANHIHSSWRNVKGDFGLAN